MTGGQAKRARKAAGLTQQQAAAKLGVTQAYLSMLERGRRPITSGLAEKLARQYGPRAARSRGKWTEDEMARQLGNLGYPGFGYLRSRRKRNPTELLAWAFSREILDARLARALPWVVYEYEQVLDWDSLLDRAKLHDGQNRLGFVVSMARRLAERQGDAGKLERLRGAENDIERSRLLRETTFFEEARTDRFRSWLREQQCEEARFWRLLTDFDTEQIHDAG